MSIKGSIKLGILIWGLSGILLADSNDLLARLKVLEDADIINKLANLQQDVFALRNIIEEKFKEGDLVKDTSADETTNKYYLQAKQALKQKNYTAALDYFQDYLWYFPQGLHCPVAQYWIGEIYYIQWLESKENILLEQAVQALKIVAENYAQHIVAADALFKLGLIEIERGNASVAKTYLQKLIKQYPGNSQARAAEAKLQQM